MGLSRMLMNFMGLWFKLRTKVVVVGIGGWRKKNNNNKKLLGLVSLGIGVLKKEKINNNNNNK